MSDSSSTPAPAEQPTTETPAVVSTEQAPKRIDLKALLRPIPPADLEAP